MSNIQYTKEDVQTSLRTGLCNIAFLKKDGSTRQMTCTLNENHIPQSPKSERSATVTDTEDSPLRVYDTVSQGWRSFYVNTLTKFESQA